MSHRQLLLLQRLIRPILFLIVLLILIHPMRRLTYDDHPPHYNFDHFNNETGASSMIIPNIIHFIRFNMSTLTFTEMICIRAAHLAQKPNAIYFHTNINAFEGKYWLQLQQKWPDTYKLIQLKRCEIPLEIFGRPLNTSFNLHHASDIERARILTEYGGIYLDSDVFIVQNLDHNRKFEMVLEWNAKDEYMGNQVLLAHKDARCLRLSFETFRDYRSDLWYYNGGEFPTTAILYQHPEIIHRVQHKFGTDTGLAYYLFTQNWNEWKTYEAFHVLVDHRHYMYKENYEKYPEFNEDMIANYNFTFGEMLREIYFG